MFNELMNKKTTSLEVAVRAVKWGEEQHASLRIQWRQDAVTKDLGDVRCDDASPEADRAFDEVAD